MANKKISALDSLGGTPAGTDVIPITDVSGTPTTKKVTVNNLMGAAPVQTSDLGTSAGLNVGTSATNVVQLADVGGTVKLPAVDGSLLTNLPASAVDGTAVTSTGETGATKFLREDGDGTCSFQTVTVTDENLRGTDNPHMGAFSNQSFLVVDNPSKSVMLGSDPDGKLYLITSSGRASIATGISVVEDSSEPDIEITTSTGTYSLISGDSDTKDANNLPAQQGFNPPDIGAFSSPLLISGGSIA